MIDMLLITRSWCTMGVILPPLVSLIKMTATQSRHTMVMPMLEPPTMKEVPYMVTVVGMNLNFTTWPLLMRVGVRRKSPLMFEVPLSTAGYKFKSVVMYTDMEVELIQSRHSMVPAVPKLPRL